MSTHLRKEDDFSFNTELLEIEKSRVGNGGRWKNCSYNMKGGYPGRIYGPAEYAEVNKFFKSRDECYEDQIHRTRMNGLSGKYPAPSVVANCDDNFDYGDYLFYSGQGKPPQAMTRFNLSLKKNMNKKIPVRVVRGHKLKSKYSPHEGYRYSGLYWVVNYTFETKSRKYIFKLFRMVGQTPLWERKSYVPGPSRKHLPFIPPERESERVKMKRKREANEESGADTPEAKKRKVMTPEGPNLSEGVDGEDGQQQNITLSGKRPRQHLHLHNSPERGPMNKNEDDGVLSSAIAIEEDIFGELSNGEGGEEEEEDEGEEEEEEEEEKSDHWGSVFNPGTKSLRKSMHVSELQIVARESLMYQDELDFQRKMLEARRFQPEEIHLAPFPVYRDSEKVRRRIEADKEVTRQRVEREARLRAEKLQQGLRLKRKVVDHLETNESGEEDDPDVLFCDKEWKVVENEREIESMMEVSESNEEYSKEEEFTVEWKGAVEYIVIDD